MAGLWSVVLVLTSCRSTQEWREQADERAGDLIRQAQETALQKSEPIEVESPADSLRRRLLQDQNLEMADEVSQGIRALKDEYDPETKTNWRNSEHLKEGAEVYLPWSTGQKVRISLTDALLIAARNNSTYQNQKEQLFRTALALDLEADEFRSTFSGKLNNALQSSHNGNRRVTGTVQEGIAGFSQTFKNGTELAASLSVDLVKLLTKDHGSAWGVLGDASISIPLLRGSGKFVVMEPLRQAERNLIYQVRSFEQYKREFLVSVTRSYLGVLKSWQSYLNQEENYKRAILSSRRSRRMADSGSLAEYEFDQNLQNELSSRANWISARQSYDNNLDSFKILLGLPPDADIEPMYEELSTLQKASEQTVEGVVMADYSGDIPNAEAPVELVPPDDNQKGINEIDLDKAISLALKNRPDLQNALDAVEDAKRAVLVAEDGLRAELTLGGRASVGESRSLAGADGDNGDFRVSRGSYSGFLNVNMPWHRTAERNAYRNSLIALERAVREYQTKEDSIKQEIRGSLRNLVENRSAVIIQWQALHLAERRVKNTDMLLQAGRVEVKDVLDAQSALLSAQNSLNSAIVAYRIQELELQQQLGMLQVNVDGTWEEADLSAYK